MKKSLPLIVCCLMLAGLFSGCSPSPTAVVVGGRKVDASEYAFYLNYNQVNLDEEAGTLVHPAGALETARAYALSQIVTNEVVRLKCRELGLALRKENKKALRDDKDHLIRELGGKAAYLEYLKQSNLTDRAYDKFQENEQYYALLSDYVQEDAQTYFTDERLRLYFSEHYATVKYIYFSSIDESGALLPLEDRLEKKALAGQVLQLAQAPDGDFDALVLEYNEDPAMGEGGYPVGELEAASTYYLTTLFRLKENQVSDLLTYQDGWYILKRCPLSATFYEENRQDIFLTAVDWRFQQQLEAWKTEYTVTVEKVVDEITLENLADYVK